VVSNWIKLDDKQLDWPLVSFTVAAREIAVFRSQGGPVFNFEDPAGVERDACALLDQAFPEYKGAVLLGYGSNGSSLLLHFTYMHRDFPRVRPGEAPPKWSMTQRCSSCNSALRQDIPWDGPSTLYYRQDPRKCGGREKVHALCVPCQTAGLADHYIKELSEPMPMVVMKKLYGD
jgi:hypothetical protein